TPSCPRFEQAVAGPGQRQRQRHSNHPGGGDAELVASDKFLDAITGPGGTGQDRLLAEVSPNISRQSVGRLVAVGAVLLQRLEGNPVKVATQLPGQPLWLGTPMAGDVGESMGQGGVAIAFERAEANRRPGRL